MESKSYLSPSFFFFQCNFYKNNSHESKSNQCKPLTHTVNDIDEIDFEMVIGGS